MSDNDRIHELAKILAVEMTARTGELWRADIATDDDWYPLIKSESACLRVRLETWPKTRLRITADAPRGMKEKKAGDSISCNPDRAPEAIAADIARRLLQHAREHLTESRQYDYERRKEEAEKQLRLNLLKKYLPREYQPGTGKLWDENHPSRLFAELTYNNQVKLEITCTLAEALKILKGIHQ